MSTWLFVTVAPFREAAQYTVPEKVAAEKIAVSVILLRVFETRATVRTGAIGSSVGATNINKSIKF